MRPEEYFAEVEMAWCPGCGNFAIRKALAQALSFLRLPPERVVLVTGIGQAAKIVHYLRVNGFDGLHGRTIAAAAGIKMANPTLTVIAESGDGDLYGEGGNHLLHNIRRNLDLTVIAHDNRVYGLTKGQASPTAPQGYTTRAQPFGVLSRPLNPLALAIALGAGFVAQAFSGEVEKTAEILARAIRYKGFALVNVLHPCPSWNRVQTFAWYKERLQPVEALGHDPTDRLAALALVLSSGEERLPVGVLVEAPPEPTWEERHPVLRQGPLVGRPLPRPEELRPLLAEFL
ncbi:MAG: thiamine pyrophosphate-dependent enzyme [Candidatus Bipolaricaulaceae bacterium]